MTNRLASATSPYLRQHADNPVHWWEWSDEAFADAVRTDRPVLLSVGYAACHWCHVMAHESFEDEAVAAVMNERFVNIKVDREERPDVDATYMAATQALTGQGGWPMTVFCTPLGEPFHAGTYFPPRPHPRLPSFGQVLDAVHEAWGQRRDRVVAASAQISRALSQQQLPAGSPPPDAAQTAAAVARLALDFDHDHGGFGGAPKFPPSMVAEFLLRHAAGSGAGTASGEQALAMATATLRAMAASGTYDQVSGGFARYAVDAGWVVPHFEKMLYDNAQLARVYLHWWRQTGDPLGRRVATEICDFLLSDLATAEGGFASSLDADTHTEAGDVEGATYVWTRAQLIETLGEADGRWAADLLGVTATGTFEHGTSTLRMLRPVDGPDADPADVARWAWVRSALMATRAARPQPGRDDKVVTAWNGLAIAALAETGLLTDRPDLVAAAQRCADLLLTVHRPDGGTVRRVSLAFRVGDPEGVLEDVADLAEGLLALYAVTGTERWAVAAGELCDDVLDRFGDGEGGFYDTATPVLASLGRRRDPGDNAHPSGWSAAAGALLTWGALTGSARHTDAARDALGVVSVLADTSPRFAGWGLAVAEAALDGPYEVAVVGPDSARELHREALASARPGMVVARGDGRTVAVPLLDQRPDPGGTGTAYVCRDFACRAPVTDPAGLRAQLAGE